MLCYTCFYMLRRQDRRQWKGTFELQLDHHDSVKALRKSFKEHCGICRAIWEELSLKLSPEEPDDAEKLSITASIAAIPDQETTRSWRLEFKIYYATVTCQRTFVLKKTGRFHSMSTVI